jgi:mannose-6-phosphate isomerase-like protein (cupin superfamily)
MSYPPARYTAPTGSVSATLRPGTTPPDLVSDRSAIGYLATQVTTSGEFGLYHYAMNALPSGPDPHFHRTISESFYILSGTVRLYDGTRWIDATTGDYLYVSPGGIRERYFEELAERGRSGRPWTDEELAELLRRHDQYPAPYADPSHDPR